MPDLMLKNIAEAENDKMELALCTLAPINGDFQTIHVISSGITRSRVPEAKGWQRKALDYPLYIRGIRE